MRILVFFDLPVKTAAERKKATAFRKFLLNDGFVMMQFSVYSRICNGYDAVEKHRRRVASNVPDNGSVRLLTITEKQYESIDLLLGSFKEEESPAAYEQLSIF